MKLIKKAELQVLIKDLERYRTEVGKVRDQLRATLEDFEGLHDTCESAYDDIESAIDALSELA